MNIPSKVHQDVQTFGYPSFKKTYFFCCVFFSLLSSWHWKNLSIWSRHDLARGRDDPGVLDIYWSPYLGPPSKVYHPKYHIWYFPSKVMISYSIPIWYHHHIFPADEDGSKFEGLKRPVWDKLKWILLVISSPLYFHYSISSGFLFTSFWIMVNLAMTGLPVWRANISTGRLTPGQFDGDLRMLTSYRLQPCQGAWCEGRWSIKSTLADWELYYFGSWGLL